MGKQKDRLVIVIKVITAGLVSIGLLSIFTIIYCNSGIHIRNTTGATDYKWEPNQLKTNMSEGFSWFHMDGDGFNNPFNQTNKTINNLLIGSSHMEGVNIDPTKNVGYLLNNMIPGYTYNIGMSGHQIYNCVRNMKNAIDQYNPTDFVILETDRIDLDPNLMQQVLDDTYPYIPSYDTGFLYLIQRYCPAIKHLYNQIDVWRNTNQYNTETMDNPELKANYEEVLNLFIGKAAHDATAKGARLIIFYHPKTQIDEDGKLINQTSEEAELAFINVCNQNGVIFVDMTDSFEELFTTKHTLAHGFINSAIGIGHLNESGHRAIAEALSHVIKEESKWH